MIQSPPRTIMEVFERLPEGTLAEIINNKLVMPPSPDFWHQDVVTEIATQIRVFLKEKKLGSVVVAPMDVYFDEENVYQPDVVFLASDQMNLVQKGKIKGAPAIVIEVLSRGTENRDKRDKKSVYEKHGVKEYWIAHPVTKKVIGYRLEEARFIEIPSEDGVIESQLLHLTIRF